MDDPPLFLAGHRVDEVLAEIADVVGVIQVLHLGRIAAVLPDEQADGALILLAALDEQFFPVARGFKSHTRQLHQHHDGDAGREHKHEQQDESRFSAFAPYRDHELTASVSSGSRCWCLFEVSSTSAELIPIWTTL